MRMFEQQRVNQFQVQPVLPEPSLDNEAKKTRKQCFWHMQVDKTSQGFQPAQGKRNSPAGPWHHAFGSGGRSESELGLSVGKA